jgi:hypothetical protein
MFELVMIDQAFNPSYLGDRSRKITVQGWFWAKNVRPLVEKQSKKGCGMVQVIERLLSPEFKPKEKKQ